MKMTVEETTIALKKAHERHIEKVRMDGLAALYENDPAFKRYVDEWARNHNLEPEQIFRLNILREYADYLRENKKP